MHVIQYRHCMKALNFLASGLSYVFNFISQEAILYALLHVRCAISSNILPVIMHVIVYVRLHCTRMRLCSRCFFSRSQAWTQICICVIYIYIYITMLL